MGKETAKAALAKSPPMKPAKQLASNSSTGSKQSPRSKGSDSALKNVLAKLVKSPRSAPQPKHTAPESRPLLPQGLPSQINKIGGGAPAPRNAPSPGRGKALALGTSPSPLTGVGRGAGRGINLGASVSLNELLKVRPRRDSARSSSMSSVTSRRSVSQFASPPPPKPGTSIPRNVPGGGPTSVSTKDRSQSQPVSTKARVPSGQQHSHTQQVEQPHEEPDQPHNRQRKQSQEIQQPLNTQQLNQHRGLPRRLPSQSGQLQQPQNETPQPHTEQPPEPAQRPLLHQPSLQQPLPLQQPSQQLLQQPPGPQPSQHQPLSQQQQQQQPQQQPQPQPQHQPQLQQQPLHQPLPQQQQQPQPQPQHQPKPQQQPLHQPLPQQQQQELQPQPLPQKREPQPQPLQQQPQQLSQQYQPLQPPLQPSITETQPQRGHEVLQEQRDEVSQLVKPQAEEVRIQTDPVQHMLIERQKPPEPTAVTEPLSDSTQSPSASEKTPIMMDLDMISPLSQNSVSQPQFVLQQPEDTKPPVMPPVKHDSGSAQTIPLTNLNGRLFAQRPHAERDRSSSPAATDELVMSPSNATTSRDREGTEQSRLDLQVELNAKNLEIMKLERKLSKTERPPKAPRRDMQPLTSLQRSTAYAPEAESVPIVAEHEDVVPPPMSPLQQEPPSAKSPTGVPTISFVTKDEPTEMLTPIPAPAPVPASVHVSAPIATVATATVVTTQKTADRIKPFSRDRRALTPALREVSVIRADLKDLTEDLMRFKKRQTSSPRRTIVVDEQTLAQASRQADQGIQETLALLGDAVKKLSKEHSEKNDFEIIQQLQNRDRGELELLERQLRTGLTQQDCHEKEVVWLVEREGRLRQQHASVEENTSVALLSAMKEMLAFLDGRSLGLNDSQSIADDGDTNSVATPLKTIELPPLLKEWQENCLKDLLVVHVTSLQNQELTGRVAIEASNSVEWDELLAQTMLAVEEKRRGTIESEQVKDIVGVLSPRMKAPIATPVNPAGSFDRVFALAMTSSPPCYFEDVGARASSTPPPRSKSPNHSPPTVLMAKLAAPDRGIRTPAPKQAATPVKGILATPDSDTIFKERSAIFEIQTHRFDSAMPRKTPKDMPSIPHRSPPMRSPSSFMNTSNSSLGSLPIRPTLTPFSPSPAPRALPPPPHIPAKEAANISPPRSRSGTHLSATSLSVQNPVRRLYVDSTSRPRSAQPSRAPPPPPAEKASPEIDHSMRCQSISATTSRLQSLYR
eukprot:TRINITY_DN1141_c1_g1_i1.p1 TRINITY_DN1141_c1_g1~~TRINITY_DN1141_c1_g1_i1.p1  ORF type:complete len:1244 (+),score=124.45 TRINITY_DN1141_c1_g1_i1:44-3775(+)